MNTINIQKVINGRSALTQEQGDLVYQQIISYFQNNEPVRLDFSNVERIISPFLNNAIGKLYGCYTSEQIKNLLSLYNFPEEKNATLNIVISNAKKYYSNRELFESSVKDVIENA